jgi:tetratricopeptide (TPR) repeat protein
VKSEALLQVVFEAVAIGLALSLDPSSVAAWIEQGMARVAEGKLEAALEPFRRACELGPKDQDACYYLARNLFALNRSDAAVEPFEKALRAATRDTRGRAHRAAARNFEVLGRPADAERHFRESIRWRRGQAGTGEDPRLDFGAFLFRQGRAAEALAPLEETARDTPGSARANAELGRVLLELGRLEPAAARLEAAVAANPKDWAAHLLLGKAYYRLGRQEDGARETRLGHEGLGGRNHGSSTAR